MDLESHLGNYLCSRKVPTGTKPVTLNSTELSFSLASLKISSTSSCFRVPKHYNGIFGRVLSLEMQLIITPCGSHTKKKKYECIKGRYELKDLLPK